MSQTRAASGPRRGAPPKGTPGARERILASASELFYREGIRAIGVDTVVAHSGVSKTSLYRVFESKDALIAAFAAEQDRLFWQWWETIESRHPDDPQAQLETLLTGMAKRITRADYRGCPFLNIVAEFPDREHPACVVAQAHKAELRERLGAIVAALGVADPNRSAAQLALLINGAYFAGAIGQTRDLRENLLAAAMRLLD